MHLSSHHTFPKRLRIAISGFGVVLCLLARSAWGGGSGLNTLVIANQSSSNSLDLANYYCERRQIGPENLLRISWEGSTIAWQSTEFQTNLLTPMIQALADRRLSGQIHYVVLSMDIPFQTICESTINSTTSALFYGLKVASGNQWAMLTNSYGGSEGFFPKAQPATALGRSFLTTMLTAGSLQQAKHLIDQGLAGDGSFPMLPVLLAKTTDPARNFRYRYFDNARFNARVLGNGSLRRIASNTTWGLNNLFGLQTGLAYLSLSQNTFIPGAIADSLTSYGGVIFGANDQTTLLAFIHAGATASYGTVTEPTPDPRKFPDPQVYFYQARGFNVAEAYYQSIVDPHQGLIVAEPLSAPFARPNVGRWIGASPGSVLHGTEELSVQFRTSNSLRPIQQVDLFVDGKYFQTVTNLSPCAGNVLTASFNGFPVSLVVPPQTSIGLLSQALSRAINQPGISNLIQVTATPHGDRVELQSRNTIEPNWLVVPQVIAETGPCFFRAISLQGPLPPLITSGHRDSSGSFQIKAFPNGLPCVIEATSDFANWVPVLTNHSTEPIQFVDADARNYSQRFYRITATPMLKYPIVNGSFKPDGFHLRVHAPTNQTYSLDFSTNLVHWEPLLPGKQAGPLDYVHKVFSGNGQGFYRASVLESYEPPPDLAVVPHPDGTGLLLRIGPAETPYQIEKSTDLINWETVSTNFNPTGFRTETSTSQGAGAARTTSLSASQPFFLDSLAFGQQSCVISGTIQVGTWLQLEVMKTNGVRVLVTATNSDPFGTIMELTGQFVTSINSAPELAGADGMQAEDLVSGWFGAACFNLQPRSPGLAAARMKTRLSGHPNLVISPETEFELVQNLTDLRPRNHLYLSAGVENLVARFNFDTTGLADGFHELSAVAYEGTHVRTQTRLALPVRVQNGAFEAVISAPTTSAMRVGDVIPITVKATADAKVIHLWSTGGILQTAHATSKAIFNVTSSELGAGLHPVFATVETPNGLYFRTETKWIQLFR